MGRELLPAPIASGWGRIDPFEQFLLEQVAHNGSLKWMCRNGDWRCKNKQTREQTATGHLLLAGQCQGRAGNHFAPIEMRLAFCPKGRLLETFANILVRWPDNTSSSNNLPEISLYSAGRKTPLELSFRPSDLGLGP